MRCQILILAALATAFAQQPKPEEACTVSGQVVRADNGDPLKRAVVTLRSMDIRTAAPLISSTGLDGRFEIKGVRTGSYRIVASRNGFLSQEYGQKAWGKPGVAVTLQAGKDLSDDIFRLTPAGAISGQVVNEDGERLAYVHIQAFRQTRVQGRRQWSPVSIANTNDLGEYRLFGLFPGRYFLAAQYTSQPIRVTPTPQAPGAPAESDTEEGYAPLYYPASLDPSRATPIEVEPGGDMRNVDFHLAPTRAVRIRGRVKFDGEATGGRPFLALFPRTSTFLGFMGRHGAAVDEKGEFEIRGVTPGSYWLTADLMDRNQRQTFRMPLEVGTSNIDGVNAILGPAPEVKGTIRSLDGVTVALSSVRIVMQSVESPGASPGGFATVGPDGAFTVQGISPDVYTFALSGLPENVYIAQVRLGDTDVTESYLDLAQGASGSLEITLAAGTAQVSGTINREQQPSPTSVVVLVPDGDRRKLSRFYRTAITGQSGGFTIKNVTPGEYKLFAWDELEEGIYQDPEFLQAFESKGKPVSLRPLGQETVQLELLHAAAAGQ